MFCSWTHQPDTLNHCRIWVSLSRDTQTQPFPPLCLISVQSQAYDSNSIRKKISYNRPPKDLLLISDYFVIFGASFHLKLSVAVFCISSNDRTSLYYIFKTSDASCFNLVFPFSFGQIQDWFSTVRPWKRENTSSMKVEVGKSYVMKALVYPLYLPHR